MFLNIFNVSYFNLFETSAPALPQDDDRDGAEGKGTNKAKPDAKAKEDYGDTDWSNPANFKSDIEVAVAKARRELLGEQ